MEHNRGHHVRVATPEDPASARIGESFWEFWPRTVLGSLRSAWRLETRRLRIRSRSAWTRQNHILNAWAMTAVLAACLVAAFGPRTIPFLILQGVVGFSLLEAVNYLEHYGLARQHTTVTRYEKVTALIPPLWRRVMDPRVLAHYGGDLSLANVHPRAAERLRERHPGLPRARQGL